MLVALAMVMSARLPALPSVRPETPLSSARLASGHDSAEAFLAVCDATLQGCILLDVRMPGMSGMRLQEELMRRQIHLPVIFLTGYGELSTGVDAMKLGAVDFLTKPVDGEKLLASEGHECNATRW